MDGTATTPERRLFVIERFWPGVTIDVLESRADPERSDGIRHIGWMLIPEDETVLSIVESPTVEAVIAAELRRTVRLPFSRVLTAYLGGPDGSSPAPFVHARPGGHRS